MNYIAEKITTRLLEKEVIMKEDYDIYLFGIQQLLITIVDLLTATVIGICFGKVVQTIIFVLAFMIIRSYAGGYHASTPLKCYVLTTLTIIAVLSAMKYVNVDMFAMVGLLIVASLVILLLSPVDTENKPMDDVERIYYRKKTIIVWSIEIFIAWICAIMQLGEVTECIVFAQVILGIALICGKVIR